MNLPNKLSVLRVLCIPVIVVLLYMQTNECRIAAGIVFILASITDFLDGFIARKYKLVTDFGKFIDPVADKLLVLVTLIMMLHCKLMEAWIIVVVLARELAVDGLRMVAVNQGKVIAASKLGKIKTTCQMILIIVSILFNIPVLSTWYMIAMSAIVVAITLLSAVDYFVRNRKVFVTK